MLTLGMMGLAIFLIDCIPSYETWGIAAPILILLMRAMQGLALGGEYMAVLRPTSRSTRQTAGVAFYTSWIRSSPQRSAPYSSGTTFIFSRRWRRVAAKR